MKVRSSRKSGFTLVEIMIVVAIIGLLAAIAIPRFAKAREDSCLKICLGNLRTYQGALDQYGFANERYPEALGDLVTEGYLVRLYQCPLGGSYAWSVKADGQGYHLKCEAQHTASINHVCIHEDQLPTAK